MGVPVTRQVYVDVPQPVDQPFEQLVHSVRDVHVPHPVAQPMMAQPMPMSTPYMAATGSAPSAWAAATASKSTEASRSIAAVRRVSAFAGLGVRYHRSEEFILDAGALFWRRL